MLYVYPFPPSLPQSESRSSPPASKRVLFNLGSSLSLTQNHTQRAESYELTNHVQSTTVDSPTRVEIETDDEKCEWKIQLLLKSIPHSPEPLK